MGGSFDWLPEPRHEQPAKRTRPEPAVELAAEIGLATAMMASMQAWEWLRSVWRRVMSAERGVSDDVPPHHERQSAADEIRTLPPGGATKL